MSYLANGRTDTLRVPRDQSGATVTFRAEATWEDELALGRASRDWGDDDTERGARFVAERTLRMIEHWSLVDVAGAPLPLTIATLRTGLSKRVSEWVRDEATKRWEGRPEEEEGPFDGRSPRTSSRARI